jgi:predicted PolB exonuclease-like 3'-5' exonuclease
VRVACTVLRGRGDDAALLPDKWNLRHSISLDRLARVLGLESPKTQECDGSRVAELYARGDHETIRAYCLGDVITTRHIYRRLTFADASPSIAHAQVQ